MNIKNNKVNNKPDFIKKISFNEQLKSAKMNVNNPNHLLYFGGERRGGIKQNIVHDRKFSWL